MIVLGIESSCDETAVAIFDAERGLIAEEIYSQIELHAKYGGVVPELASRDHIRKCLPLVDNCIKQAGINKSDLSAIAYTKGPGLIGALLVGASIAKSLSFALDIPAIGVHHMEAHLMAAFLSKDQPEYPFVALLVSGGHTMLVSVKAFGDYEILGQSLDDAVGEAFDKTAKLMGLPYPGGPELEKLAKLGNDKAFNFPLPMIRHPGCDFSFSGLKTAVLTAYKASDQSEQTRADIATCFQKAAVTTLLKKSQRALKQTGFKQLVVVGGVSANHFLRDSFENIFNQEGVKLFYPPQQYCTDNAAMVAYLGLKKFQKGEQDADLSIAVKTRWAMTED